MTLVAIAAVLLAAIVLPFFYLRWYWTWEQSHASGMAYFGRPLAVRESLKRRIRLYSRPLGPIVRFMIQSRGGTQTMPAFEYRGVSGPPRISSPEVFARAAAYSPGRQDLFVVTQMRCGTTWTQQIAFQVLTRGRGDLSDAGHGHLYAMSPWIDASITVPMEQAPLVGNPPMRVIKSHLPTGLCPYSPDAKYIYVTRHPVACFASIVDYHQSLLGPLAPSVAAQAEWFCSERMYWRPWPDHVAGWWEWAEERPNVLFLHYEEMTRDFAAVLARLEPFLGVTLSDEERRLVTERCSFKYMKEHEPLFEMASPTMFSVNGGEYLKSGRQRRLDEIPEELRTKVLDYCRQQLAGARYPVERFYPDLLTDAAPAGRR